jgi:hypothetical protein
MSDYIEYKTITILFIVLNGYMKLSEAVREDIKPHTHLPEVEQKRIIKYIELLENFTFNKKWNTKDKHLVYSVVSYVIHKAVMNRDLLFETMGELDKIMKRELNEKIITKDEYMYYRRTNFTIRRICNRLYENDNYAMDLTNWNAGVFDKIPIIYGK